VRIVAKETSTKAGFLAAEFWKVGEMSGDGVIRRELRSNRKLQIYMDDSALIK